jgi:long-chain acyl-CoA synthetase
MLFDRWKHIAPGKTALVHQGRTLTYGELGAEIQQRAAGLKAKAYLLCHRSELENLINFLAVMHAGGRGVFPGKNWTGDALLSYAENFRLEILDEIPGGSNGTAPFVPHDRDVFLGILSSGSTGTPKLIWKDYKAWFSAFPAQSEVFRLNTEDKLLVLDAMAYSANLNAVLHGLWLGMSITLTPLQEAKNWPTLLMEATALFLVPSHYRLLPENKRYPQIRSAVSAGEKLDVKTAAKVLEIFPNACLTEYYGAAELGHISYIQNQEILDKPTSVGRAFPGVKISIREEKIWVDSPYLSPDFRQAPTVSDLGFVDEEGYLCLLGREGRMFNRRGLNIFAEEIENLCLSHPWVLEAALLQSARRPEQLCLWVVTKSPMSSQEIRQFLLQSLRPDKLPNKIIFSQDLPRNPAGKVDFGVLAKKPVEEDSTN